MELTPQQLTTTNFRTQMSKAFQPFKQKIAQAQHHFTQNYNAYKRSQIHKKSVIFEASETRKNHKTPSQLSQLSYIEQQPENPSVNPTQTLITKPVKLCEWQSSKQRHFDHSQQIHKFYHEVFNRKMPLHKNQRSFYDFKKDQKQILVQLFKQLQNQHQLVSFTAIIQFFNSCPLYYLCYNIKQHQLVNILKDSAHTHQDQLTLAQFLTIFYIDRPNITNYHSQNELKVNQKCILSEQTWKQLKTIFSTLDTFGNQTIHLGPFIYKVKNNHSNLQLINEPAIEYPQINRTISIKKVLFNLQYRTPMNQKIQWKDIQQIFHRYQPVYEPTIDFIYKKMIENGQISKYTNNFMLDGSILTQIKNIYHRCPKYCQHFVKTKFICKQLLESKMLQNKLKQNVVRIVQIGLNAKPIKLQDQIRLLMTKAESYIDLDQLLQNFSIRGPISSCSELNNDNFSQVSSDQENEQRLKQLEKAKSVEKSNYLLKNKGKFKPVRHLTVCQQFKLSKKQGQSLMQKKTKQMKTESEQKIQQQLKKQFKANPIPAQINHERYIAFVQQMQEEKSLKRQELAKKHKQDNKLYQYLKTNTQLFNKKQTPNPPQKIPYQFSPKSIPWFVGQVYMLDKINEQKKLRRKVLNNESKKKMLKVWKQLPDIARYSENVTQQDIYSGQLEQSQQKTMPLKTKQIPNFQQLHKQFAQSLQKKKKQYKPTQTIEFNLSYHHSQPKRAQSASKRKTQHLTRKKSTPILKPDQNLNIPTTIKYQQMVNHTKNKLTQQQLEKQKQIQEQKLRVQKQKNFAKFMRKKLNQSLKKSQSLHNISSNKLKNMKSSFKKYEKQNQQDLCRIYFNVMNRPFLFENNLSSIKSSKQSAQNTMTLKKKVKKIKCSHKTSKHIHQSPLKAIEAQMYDSTDKKRVSPDQDQPYEQQESPHPYLNQSF